MANHQKVLMPFAMGTSRRRNTLASVPYVDSQTQDVLLPKQGYLSMIRLRVFLTANASAATAFAAANFRGAYGAIPQLSVETNQAAQVYIASAWMTRVLSFMSPNRLWEDSLAPDVSLSAPGGAGAFNISFLLEIPIALNRGLNFDAGLISLQSDDVEVRLKINWASFPSLFATPANITAVSGFAVPEIEYYEVPDPNAYAQPGLDYLLKTTETSQDILSTGENRWQWPRGNTYMQVVHQIILNNAPATSLVPLIRPAGDVKTLELRLQQGVNQERVTAYNLDTEQKRRYGQSLPQGVYAYDALFDTDFPGRFELGYMFIDSAAYTDLQHIFDLNNAPANSKLFTLRREFVKLT